MGQKKKRKKIGKLSGHQLRRLRLAARSIERAIAEIEASGRPSPGLMGLEITI